MTNTARIPRSINQFDEYITTTTAYLEAGTPTTNATRLGITEEEVTQWKSFNTQWSPLYALYVDKKNSRTTTVKDKLLKIISNTVDFNKLSHFLDRIAASVSVTIDDLAMFHIGKGTLDAEARTVGEKPIQESVSVTLAPLGGNVVSVKCRSSIGSRYSIYPGANCVQYLYMVSETPPESEEAPGLKMNISTKAIFNLSLGAGNIGKFLYIYLRWYNTKHPELASPWSKLENTIVT
ncbi:hypothetical protein [Microbacter margulisiae]|uniref:Uncharacterized protein n=1 Tax=Microbacter margulisiae TaxID=1350067 RepID=A0A7W5DSJ6_9PORP|nr:hypothetical protein [Microbacter margulisiae]MBB3188291.1 hypothetical protein [Microbacter margulisiae]